MIVHHKYYSERYLTIMRFTNRPIFGYKRSHRINTLFIAACTNIIAGINKINSITLFITIHRYVTVINTMAIYVKCRTKCWYDRNGENNWQGFLIKLPSDQAVFTKQQRWLDMNSGWPRRFLAWAYNPIDTKKWNGRTHKMGIKNFVAPSCS